MRCIDLIAAFELEINKYDDILNKPAIDDSLYWINQAVVKFVKDRFNGNPPKRTSFEQNEKRTVDLKNLMLEEIQTNTNVYNYPSYDEYVYEYPEDVMFVLNEDVVICDNEGEHEMDTCVFECTKDTFMYRINNSLTDFHYHYHRARPLRVRSHNKVSLLTDKNYKIKRYTFGYIKIPTEITNEDPFKEYTDFDDHIWYEIIKIAAQMYIENQSDPRYKTISNEVLTQE